MRRNPRFDEFLEFGGDLIACGYAGLEHHERWRLDEAIARHERRIALLRIADQFANGFGRYNPGFSRTIGQPKRYVRDAMHERAADAGQMLRGDNTCIYVRELKRMKDGLFQAARDIAAQHHIER
jgi:hypothetical protein